MRALCRQSNEGDREQSSMKQGDQWKCIFVCPPVLISLAVCFASTIDNTRIKHDNKSLQNTYETDLLIVHTTVKSRDRT